MLLDPVIELTIRLGFALLFGVAVAHKFLDWPAFQITVSRYLSGIHLTDPRSVSGIAAVSMVAEASVMLLCVLPSSGGLTVISAAGLLLLYGTVMLVNLLRGNVLLDCGCSWGNARQAVSHALVARNAALAVLTLPLLLPVSPREISAMDVLAIGAGVSVAALLLATFNVLTANGSHTAREGR